MPNQSSADSGEDGLDSEPSSSSGEPLAYVEVSPDGRFGRVRRPEAP